MKIGITERGDAGLDLSWVNKLNLVDGCILITKNLTDKCIDKIIENKEKLIVHVTCTGYGGSVLEPNVPNYKYQLNQLLKLYNKGFDISKVVLRIDPIIPTEKGINKAQIVLDYALNLNIGIQRIRISIIDMYPHVRKRFKEKGLPLPYEDNFGPYPLHIERVNNWIKLNFEKHLNDKSPLIFECCAEKGLDFCKKIGCVSNFDICLLGLESLYNENLKNQRINCLCLNCKTELLDHKHPCEHKCLYCYWKD